MSGFKKGHINKIRHKDQRRTFIFTEYVEHVKIYIFFK